MSWVCARPVDVGLWGQRLRAVCVCGGGGWQLQAQASPNQDLHNKFKHSNITSFLCPPNPAFGFTCSADKVTSLLSVCPATRAFHWSFLHARCRSPPEPWPTSQHLSVTSQSFSLSHWLCPSAPDVQLTTLVPLNSSGTSSFLTAATWISQPLSAMGVSG